jgi:cholesterol transport system auxiliary component
MPHLSLLTRRAALLGAVAAVSGCGAVSAINAAGTPLATFDLTPRPGSAAGRSTRRTLVLPLPDAPAALAADRILIRPAAASVTYLPGARFADDLPRVVQSLLVRSISATGRIGYVGRAEGGPVPDSALLTRIDAFDVTRGSDGRFTALVDLTLTVIDDRDQRVIGTQRFTQSITVADDSAPAIIAGFQALMDALLPAMADWALARA